MLSPQLIFDTHHFWIAPSMFFTDQFLPISVFTVGCFHRPLALCPAWPVDIVRAGDKASPGLGPLRRSLGGRGCRENLILTPWSKMGRGRVGVVMPRLALRRSPAREGREHVARVGSGGGAWSCRACKRCKPLRTMVGLLTRMGPTKSRELVWEKVGKVRKFNYFLYIKVFCNR